MIALSNPFFLFLLCLLLFGVVLRFRTSCRSDCVVVEVFVLRVRCTDGHGSFELTSAAEMDVLLAKHALR